MLCRGAKADYSPGRCATLCFAIVCVCGGVRCVLCRGAKADYSPGRCATLCFTIVSVCVCVCGSALCAVQGGKGRL